MRYDFDVSGNYTPDQELKKYFSSPASDDLSLLCCLSKEARNRGWSGIIMNSALIFKKQHSTSKWYYITTPFYLQSFSFNLNTVVEKSSDTLKIYHNLKYHEIFVEKSFLCLCIRQTQTNNNDIFCFIFSTRKTNKTKLTVLLCPFSRLSVSKSTN